MLKIRGAAGVRRSQSGNALIPAGFGVGLPEVTDDVWIDFADTAYMKWVLALPDLAGSRVKIRVTPTGLQRADDLKIVAQVKSWPMGKVMGEGQAPARLVPDPDPLGGEHFFVEVPMPGFQPWTYEKCPLYLAQVKLAQAGTDPGRGDLPLRHARDRRERPPLQAQRQEASGCAARIWSSSGTGATRSPATRWITW